MHTCCMVDNQTICERGFSLMMSSCLVSSAICAWSRATWLLALSSKLLGFELTVEAAEDAAHTLGVFPLSTELFCTELPVEAAAGA